MTTVYHLDREQKLHSNQIINYIYPINNVTDITISNYGFDKVSNWGFSCYKLLMNMKSNNENNILDFNTINSLQIELQAEQYRKLYFPDKPSRFKCLFAFEKVSDIILWNNFFKINDNSSVYQLEIPDKKLFKFDASFLIGGINISPSDVYINMYNYWSGIFSDNPLPEILIPLPVHILNKLNSSDFIF